MRTSILPLLLTVAMQASAAEIHWTEAQSPIVLVKDFEVPPGDTLVIEAGVFVSSSTKRFLIPYERSAIRVLGSNSKPVSLVNVGIDAWRTGNQVIAENLRMSNGWLQVWDGSSPTTRLDAINCSFDSTEFNIAVGTNSIKGWHVQSVTTHFQPFRRLHRHNREQPFHRLVPRSGSPEVLTV